MHVFPQLFQLFPFHHVAVSILQRRFVFYRPVFVQLHLAATMGHFQPVILCVALCFWFLCSATNILPRAEHLPVESEALIELRTVMLKSRSEPYAREEPIARKSNQNSKPAQSDSKLAAVKRKLLGRQYYTCDAGYGLCYGASSNANNSGIPLIMTMLTTHSS